MRWFTVKSRWMQVESVYFSSIGAQAYNWPGNAHELQNAVLDEAVVVQALGLQDKAIIAPTLNRRQREWVDLLADNAGGLTVTEIMRSPSGNKSSGGQPGRTLQNDLLKVKKWPMPNGSRTVVPGGSN